MEPRYLRGRVHSTAVRGLFRARGVRSLLDARRTLITRRDRYAMLAHLDGVSNADLESALVGLGAYLLLKGSRNLVQRVLQAIAVCALSRT